MKRWGSYTISHLWLLAIASSMLATAAPAETDNLSSHQKHALNTQSVRLLAQTGPVLEPGSTGAAVRDLQAMLALMGYYSGAVDGAYEALTIEAVRQFQADAGLTVDGIVGPLTWQRLLPTPTSLTEPQANQPPTGEFESATSTENEESGPSSSTVIAETAGNLPILMLDDSGDEVSRLQQRLVALNLYVGPVDGVFGPQTERAVEEFQQQAGLIVDGVVGPATWLALFQ